MEANELRIGNIVVMNYLVKIYISNSPHRDK